MSRFVRALPLLAALVVCVAHCSVLVDDEVSQLRCSQEGLIGAPACDPGQICSSGRCHPCVQLEVCDDGIDNDCDGHIDQHCRGEMSGGAGGQRAAPDGGAGGASAGASSDRD
jgi:hypothetical protein